MGIGQELIRSLESVITRGHLIMIFGALLLFFAIVSIALVYHWRNYTINSAQVKKAMTIYFVVAGVLLLGLAASLFSYIP